MTSGTAGTLLLIHTLLTLALQLTALALPESAVWLAGNSLTAQVLRTVVMQGGLILLPTLAIILYGRLESDQVVGGRSRAGSLILSAVIGLPAAVVLQGLNNLLLYALLRMGWAMPTPAASSGQLFTPRLADDLWNQSLRVILVIVLIQVLVPAVAEELMFRGVIQGSLNVRGRAGAAVFWQAVAFALFHTEPLFFLPPLLAGLLLGFLRLQGNSLLSSLLAHASLNLSFLAITPILPRLTAQYLSVSMQSTSSLFYASLIATFVAAVTLVPLLLVLGSQTTRFASVAKRGRLYPGDFKFTLALLALIATMFLSYFQAV
jgi:hypothetical protein